MDSILPIYPPFSSSQETTASIGQDELYPRPNGPSAATDADLPSSRSSHPTAPSLDDHSPNLLLQSHPYSPNRAEIESHPIRQRLSLVRDEILTGYGSAPEATSETREDERKSRVSEFSQAQEGSERLFDAMSSEAQNVQVGDAVSYAWGGGRPGGEVTQVETNDSVTMETKRGNEVHKQGEPENPAVYIARGSDHDVVKKASEISIEEKADSSKQDDSSKQAEPEKKDEGAEKKAESEEKKEEPKQEEKKQENGEPQTGDKRSAEEPSEEKKDQETNGEAKKQKTDDTPKENGEAPKKKGRPAKTDADGNPVTKTNTKKRAPKKATTESGEPRRSGRNAGKSTEDLHSL